MNDLLIGVLGALLATNQMSAVSNVVHQKTGLAVNVPDKNDPVEKEYQKLLEEDDTAQAEVDKWIKEDQQFKEKGAGIQSGTLRGRILQRFEPVKKGYDDFLKRHPNHSRARLAYGSFLSDIGEEDAGREQCEKARDLDPKNPSPWNNLANYYGHNGPVAKAFECYEKAVELNPNEPVYYQNFATTVYLFRQDAAAHFKITEQQVFEKAMGLYRKALELDPDNFLLATDFAQSYYGYKPPKIGNAETDRKTADKFTEDALAAWRVALKLARDDVERQGVYIHFARIQINAGRFEGARKNLELVTNEMFNATKKNLFKKMNRLDGPEAGTNAVPLKAEPK